MHSMENTVNLSLHGEGGPGWLIQLLSLSRHALQI